MLVIIGLLCTSQFAVKVRNNMTEKDLVEDYKMVLNEAKSMGKVYLINRNIVIIAVRK